MKKCHWFKEFYQRVEDELQINNCESLTRDMIFRASYYWKEGFAPHDAVRLYLNFRCTRIM